MNNVGKWFLMAGIIFLFGACSFFRYIADDTIPNSKYTVATIFNHCYGYINGGSSRADFYLNGNRFFASGPCVGTMVEGEKFKVIYDSIDPHINKLLLEEPVFLNGEKTAETTGIIDDISNKACSYYYFVGMDKIKKVQYYYRGTDEKYPGLKKGARFQVDYDPNYPKRAIIYFDRPVDD